MVRDYVILVKMLSVLGKGGVLWKTKRFILPTAPLLSEM